MKTIRITFHRNGERTIEAIGYQGQSCKQATKFIEDALGVAGPEQRKAEWYIENSTSLKHEAEMGFDGAKLCGPRWPLLEC